MLLCQFLVLAGNRFWLYILLLYNTEKNVLVGKKSSSHLSGRCAIVITTGKKSSSRLSGGCVIVITTGKKSSSRDFYAKLNVSNLNVTNLY